ncbi:MAG: tRNA uridine-5-carboxymethylaminomethyl(34) synthesis GTPase MnmE [Acetobacteraceae bacterium]|nr:tRNA uridine-5-carboxymethylaminomethyl(34) synthesis GTPase MnmE [Acetobacteraceae bacterium]
MREAEDLGPIGADTIFAIASGAGDAAIAMMRVSGPGSGSVLDSLCDGRPPPRRAVLRSVRDADGEELDRAIVLWMPGPRTYSGEDMAELHLHGGRAVIAGVADALADLGARPAVPGEFTRRAFLNGRMDLLEAEAVGDLIAAETAGQRQQALRQMEGELSAIYGGWAERVRRLLAHQEALIDFPDEDLPPEVESALVRDVASLRDEVLRHLDDGRRGERLRDGLVFAVTGPPNVGKSSLVNALARQDVAIVSPIPGTTRDALEARIDLGGVPVTLIDTAGLRETQDAIEAEGVRRARARAGSADLVIAISDIRDPPMEHEHLSGGRPVVLGVANKADLGGVPAPGHLSVSALTGAGLDALRQALVGEVRRLTERAGPPPLTRARHRSALMEMADRLTGALEAGFPELRGEDLRLALRALGRVTGVANVEDILDSIFSQFCIGK